MCKRVMQMTPYNAGHFQNDFNTPIGQHLWTFLQEPSVLTRMDTATYLERPAIEVIAPLLIEKFGDDAKADRVKQMIGSMVRQILERRGYRLDRQHVPIPPKRRVLFSSGSRYALAKEAHRVD